MIDLIALMGFDYSFINFEEYDLFTFHEPIIVNQNQRKSKLKRRG